MRKEKQADIIQELLASGRLVSGGFMGTDQRHYLEIIEEDQAELSRLNITSHDLAGRMMYVTSKAVVGLGTWVNICDGLDAKTDEAKGGIVCPWPHSGIFAKRVTTARRTDDGREAVWSDLSIHFIEEHSFFQGKGSRFRIEPRDLADIILSPHFGIRGPDSGARVPKSRETQNLGSSGRGHI